MPPVASRADAARYYFIKLLVLATGLMGGFLIYEVALHEVIPDPNQLYMSSTYLRPEFRSSPAATPGIVGRQYFTLNSLGICGKEP